MHIFDAIESEVRNYCRNWPVVFDRGVGSRLYDEQGRGYLDFFAGAGALNYGHNNPLLKRALLDYIGRDGVTHALDTHTVAKRDFLAAFDELVLRPRGLPYKVAFPGPGGTNAVEAALKLARKATGRTVLIHFEHSFHGMSLGSLSVTGSAGPRRSAGIPLAHTVSRPFNGDLGWFAALDRMQLPAAVIVEAVQGEGGLHVAECDWLVELAAGCAALGIPLIVDEVQMGCGRTGPFFAFEAAGIVPDLVCLSKAISGYGSPMSLLLLRPELDVWAPGEHSGTFRGFNPAFVTATAALRGYWADGELAAATERKGELVDAALAAVGGLASVGGVVRGRGLARGLALPDGGTAAKVCLAAFERGLLVETAGPRGEVVKLLPPLTIGDDELAEGLRRFGLAVETVT
ncbi:MAG TPA: aspartate aminotransferase family protein [Pseudonocardiaceae bacterium]|nr:aspartate aminotransferase family protein [Pseudonocardiaceae bacterium]